MDFDRDGLVDLVWVVHGGSPVLLKNVSLVESHWPRIKLRQAGANTQALAARVYVRVGDHTTMQEVRGDGSYLSQHERVPHFSLGDRASIDSLRVVWLDGREETRAGVTVDREVEYRHAPDHAPDPTR